MDSTEFTVHEQMDITTTCSATGFPPPSLSFLRDGEMLTSSDRIQISDVQTSTLASGLTEASLTVTLLNAVDSDSSNVTCRAFTNVPGIGPLTDTVTVTLTVLGKSQVGIISLG